MTIRPFDPADEPAVVALWTRAGLVRPWNDPHRDIARKLTVQPDLFLVGDIDGDIVASAMAGYDGHRGWVNYLAVDPACRRRGLAQALMTAIEERLRAVGCPKLNVQVRTDNEEATGFYGTIGYRRDEVVSYSKRLIPDEETPDADRDSFPNS